jgi:hypothetical protein
MYNGSKISGAKLRYTNMPQLTSGVSAKTYAQQCSCCCCCFTAILYAHVKLLVTISLFHDNPACLVVIVFPIHLQAKKICNMVCSPGTRQGTRLLGCTNMPDSWKAGIVIKSLLNRCINLVLSTVFLSMVK